MGELDDILRDFLVETQECLDHLDQDFVALEANPNDKERISSIFRAMHTVKGTCGFLGFSKLEKVAHVGESLLTKIRDGVIQLNQTITDALLASLDAIREMLQCIEKTGKDGDNTYNNLVELLTALQQTKNDTAENNIAANNTTTSSSVDSPPTKPTKSKAKSKAKKSKSSVQLDNTTDDTPLQNGIEPIPAIDKGLVIEAKSAPTQTQTVDKSPNEILAEQHQIPRPSESIEQQNYSKQGPTSAAISVDKHTPPDETREAEQQKTTAGVSESTIRVDVKLLDRLVNLVGELVLSRNQVSQFGTSLGAKDSALATALQRLNIITTDLQERVMKTRMQPIGNAWGKFPRVVRDLANACGKQVKLEMEGKETELDKSLIEAIRDPLTHMVRNAVDHGIELPEDRLAKGKSSEGILVLKAYHESGQVIIEIIDDGAGISRNRLINKALEKGLMSNVDAERWTEKEILNLLFLPGFSTAEKVTNVSGRGVGMDVVKTNIEKVGGNIEIQSIEGEGTTIRVRIPLTLAIVPALIITCGNERYAIPQMSLIELVRLDSAQTHTSIEKVGGASVYRLREKLLPLSSLSRLLFPKALELDSSQAQDCLNIVVLQAADKQFGLIVDEIQDNQEIVVKPLGSLLRNVSMYAGATILGDGKVALILDVTELGERCGVVSQTGKQALNDQTKTLGKTEIVHRVLVCQTGNQNLMAIPLSQVTRLEKLSRKSIEHAGNRLLVQYRGDIMQLLDVANVISDGAESINVSDTENQSSEDLIDVVVYSVRKKSVGLMVEKIADIVETSLDIQGKSSREGIMCTISLDDRIVEVLDVNRVIRIADPQFFK